MYRRVSPPGAPIPIHVDQSNIPDDVPSDGELQAVVREFQNKQAPWATGLQAEHIKVWLRDVVCEEAEESDVGLRDKWRLFVKLMQAVWEQGSIPE